ncbi:MAG: hypothetical protein EBU88_15705 [Acidobacteria bacterium]|nr:hypothetical protein [Acidobacteriota bacterium]
MAHPLHLQLLPRESRQKQAGDRRAIGVAGVADRLLPLPGQGQPGGSRRLERRKPFGVQQVGGLPELLVLHQQLWRHGTLKP